MCKRLVRLKKDFPALVRKEYPAEVRTTAGAFADWIKSTLGARKHKEWLEKPTGQKIMYALRAWVTYTREADYQPGADEYW